MKINYPAKVSRDGDGYLVEIIGLENCMAGGDTKEEALFNAAEALSGVLQVMLEEGEQAPEPIASKTKVRITPDADIQVALLTQIILQQKKNTVADLARLLGTSWPRAQELTKAGSNPTLKKLDKLASSLGKRLQISFE